MFKEDKPFYPVFRDSNGKKKTVYCSLCANVGIESVVNSDSICERCGDTSVRFGAPKGEDDDLFVVNAGGSSGDSNIVSGSFDRFSASFGGVLEAERPPPKTHKSLHDALVESELS